MALFVINEEGILYFRNEFLGLLESLEEITNRRNIGK